MYTHKKSKNGPTKIKSNRLTWSTKETKNDIHLLRTKLTKATKTKQTNKYGEKEKGKKEKKE